MEKIRELERYFESLKGHAVWKKGMLLAVEILDIQRLKTGRYTATILEGRFRVHPKGAPQTVFKLSVKLTEDKEFFIEKILRMDEPEGIAALLVLFQRLGHEIRHPWDMAKGLAAINAKGITVDIDVNMQKEFQFVDIVHVYNPIGTPAPVPPKKTKPASVPESIAPPEPRPAEPPPTPVSVVIQSEPAKVPEKQPEIPLPPPPAPVPVQDEGDDLIAGNRILALVDGAKVETTILAIYEDSGEFVLQMPDGSKKLVMAQGAYIRKLT